MSRTAYRGGHTRNQPGRGIVKEVDRRAWVHAIFSNSALHSTWPESSVRMGVERNEAGVLRRVRSQSSEMVKKFEFFMIV